MGRILFTLLLFVINAVCTIWMYKTKHYKSAILNGFAAGVSFWGLMDAM